MNTNRIQEASLSLIKAIGENHLRDGLQETPKRMAKAWTEWTSGYRENAEDVLKAFDDGAEGYGTEFVHVGNIPFYSMCEHHLAPFFGEVFFGYRPSGKIVGLSKMSRLVDVFARRLQVQERLTVDILQAFVHNVKCEGAGIIIRARHLCMESRGICCRGCVTTTSAFNAVTPEDRARFRDLCQFKDL